MPHNEPKHAPIPNSITPARRRAATVIAIVGLIAVSFLAARPSANAWVLGRYSLPKFLSMIAVIGTTLGAAWVVLRLRSNPLHAFITIVLVSLAVAIPVELLGQVYTYSRPAYDNLFQKADGILGWRIVPDMEFTWTGHEWFARNFSNKVRINSHGFRDLQRSVDKPADTVRIALLGDSMVEALQVPLERTAGQLLEKALNSSPAAVSPARRFEVLNFGTSNYSVGQYLLLWEQVVSAYRPDYVFVFVAGIQIRRNVTAQELGAFSATAQERLAVRPTFAILEGQLQRIAAKDYERFAEIQEDVIKNEFGGSRVRRKPHRCFILDFLIWPAYNHLIRFQDRELGHANFDAITDDMLRVTEGILDELDDKIRASGAKLIVLDASTYFDAQWKNAADAIRNYCSRRKVDYIDLSSDLINANMNGVVTRWVNDLHFTEDGNRLFFEAMHRWMINNALVPAAVNPRG